MTRRPSEPSRQPIAPEASQPPRVRFGRSFHVALHYRVLAAVDLGSDAASLFGGYDDPPPPWAGDLSSEMVAAGPTALPLQFAPLLAADVGGLLAQLPRLGLPTELGARFTDALGAEQRLYAERWTRETGPAEARVEEVQPKLTEPLVRARERLWTRAQVPAPPLIVLDAPAMGPHGRGTSAAGRRYAVVSLAEPTDHAFCQIFHEEVHAVSDREIRVHGDRDTRGGSAGFVHHQHIEQHAIEVGAEVIDAAAPDFADAYRRWRGR